jgi:hypothetical protein
MAQVKQYLSSKCKALSSNINTTKKKKKKRDSQRENNGLNRNYALREKN